jgi:hypothetical protein
LPVANGTVFIEISCVIPFEKSKIIVGNSDSRRCNFFGGCCTSDIVFPLVK